MCCVEGKSKSCRSERLRRCLPLPFLVVVRVLVLSTRVCAEVSRMCEWTNEECCIVQHSTNSTNSATTISSGHADLRSFFQSSLRVTQSKVYGVTLLLADLTWIDTSHVTRSHK